MFEKTLDEGLPETVSQNRVPIPVAADPDGQRGSKSLDSPQMLARHIQLMGHYNTELARQFDNRMMQAKCFDYYDNEQWSEEEKQELQSRGQKPMVYNVIATTIDWITGTQKRSRTDFKVLPRKKEGGRAAELKGDTLKYLSDTNGLEFHRSRAFEEAVKGGIGWLEDQWQGDGGKEPVYSRFESWRNMLWDTASTEMDLSDARYVFRSKWVDLDIAISWFPDRQAQLEASASTNLDIVGAAGQGFGDGPMDSAEDEITNVATAGGNNEFAYHRRRVRLIEAWYKIPKPRAKWIRGGQFHGERYDPTSRGQYEELHGETGVVVVERTDMEMRCAIMTPEHMIYESASPYRHGRFPFTPIWCYRRNSNGLPYGVIRRVLDLQDDVNMRAAKARHILATSKTFMEEGAVEDLDDFHDEINQPDAVIVYKTGKKIEYNADREMAVGHVELMNRSIEMIQSVGGVTDENRGVQTNAKSGIAIARRQEQGALATAGIFDNLLLASRAQGEKQLSLVEQFFTEEKTFRITNARGVPVFVTINGRGDDGGALTTDDITRSKADFIISEDEWSATVREAKTQKLLDMLQIIAPAAPEAMMVMIDLIVEGMDITNRDEIVRRLRQLTGMRDPDQTEPTPEEMALEQKKSDAEKRQVRMQEAEIADKEASAAQKKAAAGNLDATREKMKAALATDNVGTLKAALEAALIMLQAPGAAPVADTVAREAGFIGATEKHDAQQVDAKAADLEQLAAEGAVMQEAAAAAPPDAGGEEGPPPPATTPPAAPAAPTQPPM